MADVSLRHNTASPTLRDKIRLFEGKGNIPLSSTASINRSISSSEFRSNSPYRGPRLSPVRNPSIERDRIHERREGEKLRRHSTSPWRFHLSPAEKEQLGREESREGESSRGSSLVPHLIPIAHPPPSDSPNVSPRKWNVIHSDPEPKSGESQPPVCSKPSSSSTLLGREKGKEKANVPPLRNRREIEEEDSDEEPPTASPRKWHVIHVEPEPNVTPSREKEKVNVLSLDSEQDLTSSDDEEEPKMSKLPTLAKSPRMPPPEQKYEEEEVIKLKGMTAEEKQMVKALINLTTRKNKMLDSMEANIQKERQVLAQRVEAEKTALSAKLQSLDLELAAKSRELSAEIIRSGEFAERIQKLERERQDIRMALAASKRELRQCKINCDAELNKKTQSLMDMAMQLTALTCLRQSMNCIICEEKVATAVLQPCRHMVMCGPCSHKVTKCPMCRVDIRSKFEVYNNWVI